MRNYSLWAIATMNCAVLGVRRVLSITFFFLSLFLSIVTPVAYGESHDVKTITITCNDTMRYDTTAFEVNAGEKVRIVLKNVGTLPKAAMGHNFIILKQGVNMAEFAQAAMTAAATDYIPEDKKDDIIVHTKLLGPGESDTIEFSAPDSAGSFEFLCSFPGHWALMKGVMTVK